MAISRHPSIDLLILESTAVQEINAGRDNLYYFRRRLLARIVSGKESGSLPLLLHS